MATFEFGLYLSRSYDENAHEKNDSRYLLSQTRQNDDRLLSKGRYFENFKRSDNFDVNCYCCAGDINFATN